MPAYVIARVEVRDWDRYRQYMKHTPAVIAKFGGRFIVRGAEIHTLEGAPDPRRIVIIEFPSLDDARAFHASDDYAPVKALRDGAGEGQFIAVDGFASEAWAETLAASVALGPPG
jgi:uncharacterized protein (DUF1330 family)